MWIKIHHLKVSENRTLDQRKLGQITAMHYNPRSKAEKWQIRAPINLYGFIWKVSAFRKSDIGSTVLKLGQITEYANFGPIPWIIAHGPRPKNDKLWPLPTYGLKHIIWKVSFSAFRKSEKCWHWINGIEVRLDYRLFQFRPNTMDYKPTVQGRKMTN